MSDTFGRIRCLGNTGEWQRLIKIADNLKNKLNNLDDNLKREWGETLPLIVKSYLQINNLTDIEYFANQLSDDNVFIFILNRYMILH